MARPLYGPWRRGKASAARNVVGCNNHEQRERREHQNPVSRDLLHLRLTFCGRSDVMITERLESIRVQPLAAAQLYSEEGTRFSLSPHY